MIAPELVVKTRQIQAIRRGWKIEWQYVLDDEAAICNEKLSWHASNALVALATALAAAAAEHGPESI